jgi:hypothetical protein
MKTLLFVLMTFNAVGQEFVEDRPLHSDPRLMLTLKKSVLPNKSETVKKRIKVYALVIGINNYYRTNERNLTYCVKDAIDYRNFLKTAEGGGLPEDHLVCLIDDSATRNNTLKRAKELYSKADSSDIVYFFFSGHGGENIFLMSDGILFHQELKEIIYNCRAKIKFCIADACHSGSWDKKIYPETKDFRTDLVSQRFYDANSNLEAGIPLFMACRKNETSIDDTRLKNGLFTYYFLKGLKGAADRNNDGKVTITEIYAYTRSNVEKRARETWHHQQTPQMKGFYDPKEVLGIKPFAPDFPKNKNGLIVRHQEGEIDTSTVFSLVQIQQQTNLLRNLLDTINKDYVQQINECIINGANINTCSRKYGWTALHIAAIFNDSILAENILRFKEANLNMRDSLRLATPLWYAAKRNSYKVAEMMLSINGVNVNAFEKHGSPWDWHYSTALDVASSEQMKQLLWKFDALKFDQLKFK